ncbi:MAG: hypothetical protein K2X46_07560 [Roseomonas sp.]|nr:hypothetical protein [Roseomonas sp.]
MRGWLMGLGLAVILAAPAGAQTPERRAAIQADAEAQLLPCPDPRHPVCGPTREMFLLAYPGARAGTERNQLQVAELLAEGATPPMRRNPIDACAWASIAASLSARRGADGRTPSRASMDAVSKRCLSLDQVQQNTAQLRARELLAVMGDDLRR